MSDRDRIISRVQKLLAFDENNASEGEIENALKMAQNLMEAHAIEQAELEAESQSSDPVVREQANSKLKANVAKWESWLGAAVRTVVPGVDYYQTNEYVRAFDGTGKLRRQSMLVWYGPADLVEVAKALFDETRAVIATLAQGNFGGVYKGQGRSYCEGFASALHDKAYRQRQENEEKRLAEATEGAIVLRMTDIVKKAKAENSEWLQEAHGIKLTSAGGGGGGHHYGDAYGEGKKDGQRHDFTPGKPTGKLAGGRLALPGA